MSQFSGFSESELKEILKAWAAISLMFAIAINGIAFDVSFLYAVFFAAITAGIGFIVHELAHKFTAELLGCRAEFRAFDSMLFIGVLLSVTGFIFAAPGAVMIQGRPGKRENGMISSAGIAGSLLTALVFFIINIFSVSDMINSISFYGQQINSWIAMFNLIPFGNFDGRKVLNWNKIIYIVLLIFALGLMFF
ncbi:metalloprotease [Candidatus Woesearchaeota archaeon]|nr:metalloprotease [Candidatus Woesearchaeota archaeon]